MTKADLTLNNGAEVLAYEDWVVLAKFNGKYVTWIANENGDAFWGHYFNDDIVNATKDFEKRVKNA